MFQTYAMITQHANHLATVTTPIKVIKRSIHSSFGVFAELLHKQEKLLPVERAILQHLYSSLKTNTDCTMHCVVYIEVPTSLAAHRLSWRGREEERQEGAIDTNYLRQVDEQYEEFFRALPVPIIHVDGRNDEPKVILHDVLDRLSELCPFIKSPQNATA
jgi:deoxyadenosine/deoxycytidine kinase